MLPGLSRQWRPWHCFRKNPRPLSMRNVSPWKQSPSNGVPDRANRVTSKHPSEY